MNPIVKENEIKHNYLAAAEMDEEGNYNMIDGVINNVAKPSVLERIKEYERNMSQNTDKSLDIANSEKSRTVNNQCR